jgi:hypothetical protein
MDEQPFSSQIRSNWPVFVMILLLGMIPVVAPWCNSWHWSRHPPTVEHRRELIELAAKQFRCPPEELAITASGEIGAEVRGCGGWTKLCWRQLTRLGPFAWRECYLP